MIRREIRFKGLDSQPGLVRSELLWGHERDCAEPAHLDVVQGAAVLEVPLDAREVALGLRLSAVGDEEAAGEAERRDEAITGSQIHYHELCSPPTLRDRRPR